MSNLVMYCGSCRKPVAVVNNEDDLSILFGSLDCPKCGKKCIQDSQAVLRDPVIDEVFTVKVKSKPVVEVKPVPKIVTKKVIPVPHVSEKTVEKHIIKEQKKVTKPVTKTGIKKPVKGKYY